MRTRAKALSPVQRRAALIDAVLPLLVRYGRAVTTRQIAEAAGVAEGTIFRVFATKEELVEAAILQGFDMTEIHAQLVAIDPALGLEDRCREIVRLWRARYEHNFALMHAVGLSSPPLLPTLIEGRRHAHQLIAAFWSPTATSSGPAPTRPPTPCGC